MAAPVERILPPDWRNASASCGCCGGTSRSCARGLTRLALFGSTARGDLEPDSDVALLIEGDPERRFGLFAFLDLAFADAMRPKLRAAVLRDAVEVF